MVVKMFQAGLAALALAALCFVLGAGSQIAGAPEGIVNFFGYAMLALPGFAALAFCGGLVVAALRALFS